MKTITYNPETHVLVPREPNHNWCAGCSPDNCSGCGTEPVESEPVCKASMLDEWFLAKSGLDPNLMLYTTPQPDRTAELEQLRQLLGEYISSADSVQEAVIRLVAAYRDRNESAAKFMVELNDTESELEKVKVERDELRQRVAELEERRCEVCGYAEHHREHTGCLRKQIEKLTAERDAAITNLRVEQIAHLSLTDLLEKENVQLKSALKVAREGIDEFLVANDPTEFGCACDLSVGYLCGPCHADMQQQPLKSAIAKINEVLKP